MSGSPLSSFKYFLSLGIKATWCSQSMRMGAFVRAKFCAWSQVGTCAYGPASKQWDLPKPGIVAEEPALAVLCLSNLEPSSHKE